MLSDFEPKVFSAGIAIVALGGTLGRPAFPLGPENPLNVSHESAPPVFGFVQGSPTPGILVFHEFPPRDRIENILIGCGNVP